MKGLAAAETTGGTPLPFPGKPEGPPEVLPDRTRFESLLADRLDQAIEQSKSFSLFLLSPDDFGTVNAGFGWKAGDQVLGEIATRVSSVVRRTDPVARYGGASIAILVDSPGKSARMIGENILECVCGEPYLDGQVLLEFSLGVATFDPVSAESRRPAELMRRVAESLSAAKRKGGGQYIDWNRELGAEDGNDSDQLRGIFTGNLRGDYRNMSLLWSTVNGMAASASFEELAGLIVEQIWRAYLPDRIGIFELQDAGGLRLVRGLTRVHGSETQQRLECLEARSLELEIASLAMSEGEPREARHLSSVGVEAAGGDSSKTGFYSRFVALPLLTGSACLGALLLGGREPPLAVSTADRTLLQALCSQLALALDRFRLSEKDRRRRRDEKRQLAEELRQLRKAVVRTKLIFSSQKMESLLDRSRRVAATDATVLITGDSGTGKNLLARTVHELSPRRDKPFVVVDCTAIAPSLVERELFGNQKGAYTGAERSRPGLIVQSEGGTVVLDEIGELPLEVQSKLLRLVEEKELTPVGGTKPVKVNARIIACTNRDMHALVKAGQFREDLFHRLNVVRLHVHQLRERPADILPLARFFLKRFAVQFQQAAPMLTPEAEEALMQYPWPGNVRELQNRLMQTLIFSDDARIGLTDLALEASEKKAASAHGQAEVSWPAAVEEERAEQAAQEPVGGAEAEATDEPWELLRRTLGEQVAAVKRGELSTEAPVGRWLADDLVVAAVEGCGGEMARAARMLGYSPATCRRRLTKARARLGSAETPSRPDSWNAVREVLARIGRGPQLPAEGVAGRADLLLLGEIIARYPGQTGIGSALLGVSLPTFRKRVRQKKALCR